MTPLKSLQLSIHQKLESIFRDSSEIIESGLVMGFGLVYSALSHLASPHHRGKRCQLTNTIEVCTPCN